MTLEIEEITNRTQQVVELALTGAPAVQIAENLDIPIGLVRRVLNSAVVKQKLSALSVSQEEEDEAPNMAIAIAAAAPKAFLLLERALLTNDEAIEDPFTGQILTPLALKDKDRVEAAKVMLSMAGHGPVTRNKAEDESGILRREVLEELNKKAVSRITLTERKIEVDRD